MHSPVPFFTYPFPYATSRSADFGELDRALALAAVGGQVTGTRECSRVVAQGRSGWGPAPRGASFLLLACTAATPFPCVSGRKPLLCFAELCASPLGSPCNLLGPHEPAWMLRPSPVLSPKASVLLSLFWGHLPAPSRLALAVPSAPVGCALSLSTFLFSRHSWQ